MDELRSTNEPKHRFGRLVLLSWVFTVGMSPILIFLALLITGSDTIIRFSELIPSYPFLVFIGIGITLPSLLVFFLCLASITHRYRSPEVIRRAAALNILVINLLFWLILGFLFLDVDLVPQTLVSGFVLVLFTTLPIWAMIYWLDWIDEGGNGNKVVRADVLDQL